MLAPRRLVLLAAACPLMAHASLPFAGPAFADGPYNSVLGALGSRDKAIVSQEGQFTRLFASDGATGMGRAIAPPGQPYTGVGESIRFARQGGHARTVVQAAYDEELPDVPVHLTSTLYTDGVEVAVRALQVGPCSTRSPAGMPLCRPMAACRGLGAGGRGGCTPRMSVPLS